MTDFQDHTTSSIGDAFRQITANMKSGLPVWEDFLARGVKFQKQLDHTVTTFNAFLDGMNKVAEVASRGKGATSDIGAVLSDLVLWHMGQELKLRELSQVLLQMLLNPLQLKLEEWKKTASQMDREHEKELTRSLKEIKESTKATLKTQKSLNKKDKPSAKRNILQHQYEHNQQETDRKVKEMEDRERLNLNRAILEERKWFCGFASAFSRSLDVEIGMYGDLEKLQALAKELNASISKSSVLPDSAKEFVESWSIPSSPGPRKRATTHSSSISLNSSSSLGSEDSINAAAPPPPPPPGLPLQDYNSGGGVPSPPGPPPPNFNGNAAPPPPPPGPPPNFSSPPSPPGPPPNFHNSNPPPPPPANVYAVPGPPHSNFNHTAPQNAVHNNFAPPPPPGHPPNYHPPTQNYSSHLPPPPQPNFPHLQQQQQSDAYYHTIPSSSTAGGSVSTGRPLPPVSSYEEQSLEPVSPPISAMSVSSSHSSLMSTSSHQSTESSRSLSPPVGCSKSPGTTRAYLGSVQEEVDPAPSLQQALVNRLRLRSKSMESRNAASTTTAAGGNTRGESETSPPPRGGSGGGNKGVAPPVAHKPPRAPSIPHKPSRSSSLASIGLTAPSNGAQSHHNILAQQSHSFSSLTLPHPRTQRSASHPSPPVRPHSLHEESDSEPEDESPLAKALRQKKLRKTTQVKDKSAPVLR